MEKLILDTNKFWEAYQQSLIDEGMTMEELDYYKCIHNQIRSNQLNYFVEFDNGKYSSIAKKLAIIQQTNSKSHLLYHFAVDSDALGIDFVINTTIQPPVTAKFINERLSLLQLGNHASGANLHIHRIIENYSNSDFYDILRLGILMVLNSSCFDSTTLENSYQDYSATYLTQFIILVGLEMPEHLDNLLSLSNHAPTSLQRLRKLKSDSTKLSKLLEIYAGLTHIVKSDAMLNNSTVFIEHLNSPGLTVSPNIDFSQETNLSWIVDRAFSNSDEFLEHNFTNPEHNNFLPRRVRSFIKSL